MIAYKDDAKSQSMISKITGKKTFSEKILNVNGLHIVRFCAVWSGPCHIMAPVYEEMSMLFQHAVSFYRIDIDEAPLLKKEFAIAELPTILFFKNGIVVEYTVGLISKELFTEKINQFIKS
jgi:thioredoxin 1